MRGWIAIYLAMGLAACAYGLIHFGWPFWLAAVLITVSMGCVYFALAGMAIVTIFLRAMLALLPIGALAGAIIYGVVQADFLETDETRAVVAAIVVAAGWVVAFVTGELRQTNLEQERRRDVVRAALVEVQQIIAATSQTDWDRVEDNTKALFFDDHRYEIFVMYGSQYKVLKRLVEQIEILRKHQIERVMALFQLLDRLSEIETRFDMDGFRNLPWERRQDAVLRYINLQRKVPAAAIKAEDALKDAPFWGWLRRLG